MESVDFLKDQLEKLSKRHPISIKYQFDGSYNNHIIEIHPAFVFDCNQSYRLAEADLIYDFLSQFPEETILFVKKDDLIRVTNPILEIPMINTEYSKLRNWIELIKQNSTPFIIAPVTREKSGENDFALAA
ncbi:MAG: hypothetical protein M0Q51_03235 [Bacteroidales bacterium]|nr:hypothetical protein [Bacteroidales bacterium]